MARRVVPVNDWAPFDLGEHPPAAGASSSRRHRLRSFSGLPFSSNDGKSSRRRSKSVAPMPTFDVVGGTGQGSGRHDSHRDSHHDSHHDSPNDSHRNSHHDPPKHDGARVKSLLKRASVSIKGFVHRRTLTEGSATATEKPKILAAEDPVPAQRPGTAHSPWNRLRHATSSRHLRTSHGGSGSVPPASDFETWTFRTALVFPDAGAEPPIIPEHTGAAAKASAAVSNEHLALLASQQNVSLSTAFNRWLAGGAGAGGDDGESGIGIAMAGPDVGVDMGSDAEKAALPSPQLTAERDIISRVDFVGRLPTELGIQILGHLDAADLAAAARVSWRWRAVVGNQHVWHESFMREKTMTYARSEPVLPGAGLGVPPVLPTNDWREIYRAREQLDRNWELGKMSSVSLLGHTDSIYCVQFDEHKIITGSRDRTIRVWDMHTHHCRLVVGPPEVVGKTDMLVGANGRATHYAVFEDHRRPVQSTPRLLSYPTHHDASILCLQYDDEILVTGSSDSTCIVHDMRDGLQPLRRLRFHEFSVLDLAFDGEHIVTCSKDVTICVWDRATGQLLRQLRGHGGPVNSVQMRGNSIVSCSGDCLVKLWNVDSGKNIREFVGHTKGLACSQFSEDGRYVASAGNEMVIRLWDANTGECLHELRAHDGLVRSLHIDSVSGRLVSGSYDSDIKVFDLGTGDKLLEFPKWHQGWVLGAKSDYRRIVSTGQAPKILIMDFGGGVEGIEALETPMTGVDRKLLGYDDDHHDGDV